jgi:hypothetical protein
MRINPINISISNAYYNPIRWVADKIRPQRPQTVANNNAKGPHQVNTVVDDRYFKPQLVTPYQNTTTAKPGQKSLAVANFAAENMDLWQAIKKTFGIELINTVEAAFSRPELEIIFQTLAAVPKKHLQGVKTIIKSYSLGLDLALMHTRATKRTVLGAYQKQQKQIYLFASCPLPELRKTLLHEIGHAVHSYCVSPATILKTAKKTGWQLKEFRPSFLADNTFYPIVLQTKPADAKAWEEALYTFSETEIKNKRTGDGKFVLEAPAAYRDHVAYQNPLETFACLYAQQYN